MKKNKKTALIILDMINLFDFPEAKSLLPKALKAAKTIVALKRRLSKQRVPVIYVNDNFGGWHSDWKKIFSLCLESKGHEIAKLLAPTSSDYFILKPKHSGFYMTALELLLKDLKIDTLILTGIAGNQCVLFTAYDAHMRNFDVIVPKDCIASNTKADDEYTLHQLKSVFKFSISSSKSLD